MTRPFVIYSPPYNHASAGVRALANLRAALEALGYEAVMAPLAGRACRDCRPPPSVRQRPVDVEKAIVVLPEIIAGNPSPSPFVVRWLLNRPRYNPTDPRRGDGPRVRGLRVAYSATIDAKLPRLFVPTIELDRFYPKSAPGRGSAVYTGKGRRPADFRRPAGATIITRRQPSSAKMLAALLRRIDVLISFDPFSAINFEATLCGTPVRVFPDGRWTREQVEAGEFSINGYCWPGDDLEEARARAAGAFDIYRDELARYDGDVARFAVLAQRTYRRSR